jgi:hypothetical protein
MTSNKKDKRESWITAKDLHARLAADPEYQARHSAHEEHFRKVDEERRLDELPVVEEIGAAGLLIESVWDLVNTRERYPEAIPALVKHLAIKTYLPVTRAGIVRSLTVPEARGAPAKEIIRQLRESTKPEEDEFRWTAANALTVAATRDDVAEMEAFLPHAQSPGVAKRLKTAINNAKRRPTPK